MADKIKLVQGDTRPFITLTARQADGTTIDLTGCTVRLYLRMQSDTSNVTTIICSLPNGGADGKVMFDFPEGALATEGAYEAELEIDFGTGAGTQTVYDTLKFTVRKQFN